MTDVAIAKKICLVGDFGVGKTSLAKRYVKQVFSDKYLTTVGVAIDTKVIGLRDATQCKLIIWDIAGNDAVDTVSSSYLRGADGFLLVIDGTRAMTLTVATELKVQVLALLGDVPFGCLFNKADRKDAWTLDSDAMKSMSAGAVCALKTSAKTGSEVESAFQLIAEAVCR